MLRLFAALVTSALLVACGAPPPPVVPPRLPEVAGARPGRGVALGYQGAIETDVPLADLLQHDHTIMAWMLPEVPHAYDGPLFAASDGGTWSFGQGDYRWGKGGYKKVGAPVLAFFAGPSRAVFAPAVEIAPLTWRHVAIVRRGTSIQAYVDGQRSAEVDVPADATLAGGTLRIGRRAPHAHAPKTVYEGQFYGVVDDVAVFARALDDAEIAALARPGAHPTGAEPGLVAAFTFDGDRSAPALAHPYRLVGRAREVDVSATRDDVADANAIPLPSLDVPLRLPFDIGQTWRVLQGNCAPAGSHNGYACFSWDLVLAGASVGRTRGQSAHAAGTGVVIGTMATEKDHWVKIRHADQQFSTYMHLLHGSIRVSPMSPIVEGAILGLVGDTGAGAGNYHLHISVSNGGLEDGTATIPSAFTDYEVSEDQGRTWTHVALGVPKHGQWIRRMR